MTIRTKIEVLQTDGEFEFDGDTDLASLFLRNILSDERPAPNVEGVVPPVVAAHTEARNREAIEEDWEDVIAMLRDISNRPLTIPNTVNNKLAVRICVTNWLECVLGRNRWAGAEVNKG